MQPWQKAVKHALSMPDKNLEKRSEKKPGKQARKSQQGPSSGRVQRPSMAGMCSSILSLRSHSSGSGCEKSREIADCLSCIPSNGTSVA